MVALMALLATLAVGCIDAEKVFTQGRLEELCNGAVPVCSLHASCVLRNDAYLRGEFPGGVRVIVRSHAEEQRLWVRILLAEMIYPGTELHIQAYNPDCSSLEEEHLRNIDLFAFAGDDRIIEVELLLVGKGDHLVEVFSDMSAKFLMTTLVEN